MTKISNIKTRRYNLFIFQKTEKNRILNIHSICNYSDDIFSQLWLHIKFYVWSYFPPDIFVSFDASMIQLVHIISLWKIGLLTCGLKYLTNWGFAVESRQTFIEEILVSYFWLFWLKSKLQFYKKTTHVSCEVNVYFWSFRV